MANAYKVLGQDTPGASLTALYTVPASTEAIVFVTISNKAADAKSCRLKVAPAGAGDSDDHNIVYDLLIPANDTYVHPVPIYVEATDVVRAYGEDANVSFTATGIEIT